MKEELEKEEERKVTQVGGKETGGEMDTVDQMQEDHRGEEKESHGAALTLIYGQEATDLLLDINTAHNLVSVSGDRKSASYSLTQLHYPQSPERFQCYPQVLSSRSFPSGRHYWEVEVSESGDWGVGVAYPSIERRGKQSFIGNNNKSWCLRTEKNNIYFMVHDSKWIKLWNTPSCRRIRISLDYEAGCLSFYELSEPIRHLHTFTATFTEPLHVVFWAFGNGAWVRIIREREEGAEEMTLEREKRLSGEQTPSRKKMDTESRIQAELSMSDIIYESEKESEELVGQIPDMEEMCNMCDTLCSLLAQESHGAALCGAEGAHNEGGTDGIMAPGLAHIVLGIRTLIYGQEATDLLLDINTAHNRVSVSGDIKSASYSPTQLHYPQSPERFRYWPQTLSSRSFPSGRHYWEVEGSESGNWRVGVAYPSIERRGGLSWIGENNKSWCLYRWYNENRYSVIHDNKWTELPHVSSCRRIRISLDYEAGRLSFYELSEPIRHLHTFTATFTEPLHVAFLVFGAGAWVRIIREREKGAEVLTLERDKQIRDREMLEPESQMQEEDVVSHIIHKGETEREELVGQIPDMEEMCNMCDTLCSLLAQESHGAALCGAEGAHNEGGTDGIMAPGLAHIVLGIRTLIYGQEATDLLLDINTAHNLVSVSGDRKSASYSLTQLHYPQSPERFQNEPQTLSSRSFSSGRHYWEVEGSESGEWKVGVAYPSIERRGYHYWIGQNNKSWCLYRWDNNRYSVIHDNKWTDLPHVPSCRRIRISLDYEAGRLSFYELSEPIRHLHTFTATFTEPLHAAFLVFGAGAWVRIIREREKGAEVLKLETDRQITDREKLEPETQMQEEDVVSHLIHKGETEREELVPETQMQEEDVVSHIIHKGETEREELVGQIPDMEEMCNMCDTLCSLLAQESHGAALCGAEGAHNEGGTDGIMAPGLAHTVLGIRTLIYGQEATDLLLDINTAHNHVSVSGDRKSASYSLTQLHYPQSPERFQDWAQTLSSRSFPSGRHYWEVEGSESGVWRVGVAYPSIERRGDQSCIGNNNKSWGLYRWYNNRYSVIHDSKWTDLPHAPSCRRIRIWLDYEAGRLSFYELSEPIRHLHTFTVTFTEPLHVAFCLYYDDAWAARQEAANVVCPGSAFYSVRRSTAIKRIEELSVPVHSSQFSSTSEQFFSRVWQSHNSISGLPDIDQGSHWRAPYTAEYASGEYLMGYIASFCAIYLTTKIKLESKTYQKGYKSGPSTWFDQCSLSISRESSLQLWVRNNCSDIRGGTLSQAAEEAGADTGHIISSMPHTDRRLCSTLCSRSYYDRNTIVRCIKSFDFKCRRIIFYGRISKFFLLRNSTLDKSAP
ncbi:hypothetical protein XELAEV_18032602mg [Xenopus laevis]|uniref:B30.2/SPRY domain-containing protein n=1 Tax=Xenopus laevis TaxID=8355 RepID=A0A974HD60_XENLA|nr:hypothetical protein XELAEV_18032602mg [Xenopus laevis]